MQYGINNNLSSNNNINSANKQQEKFANGMANKAYSLANNLKGLQSNDTSSRMNSIANIIAMIASA